MSSSSGMAARIQILHGEYPSSSDFGLKEGELYVNNSGELYFGASNSSSTMVFGSKFNEIDERFNQTGSYVASLSSMINNISMELDEKANLTQLTSIKYTTDDYPTLYNFRATTWQEIAEIAQYSDPSLYWKIGDSRYIRYTFNKGTSDEYQLTIPITIIGFNHDKVSNPSEYGKAKAGLTLMIGASRKVRHGDSNTNNLAPDLFTASEWAAILGNKITNVLKENNTSFKTVNDGNKFWGTSNLRTALNNENGFLTIFSDILGVSPVAVDKYNVRCWSPPQFYTKSEVTSDKVFLLSENEVFGSQRFYSHGYDYPQKYVNSPLLEASISGVTPTYQDVNDWLTINYNNLKKMEFMTCFGALGTNRSIYNSLLSFPFIKVKRWTGGYQLYYGGNTMLEPALTYFPASSLEKYGIVVNDNKFPISSGSNSYIAIIKLPLLTYSIAPAIEGQQYEFFENTGSSKFFWSSRYLDRIPGTNKWQRKAEAYITSILLLRSSDNQEQNGTSSNNASIFNGATGASTEYNSSSSYAKGTSVYYIPTGDTVRHFYSCIKAAPANILPTNTEYWKEVTDVNYGLQNAASIPALIGSSEGYFETQNMDILPCFCL